MHRRGRSRLSEGTWGRTQDGAGFPSGLLEAAVLRYHSSWLGGRPNFRFLLLPSRRCERFGSPILFGNVPLFHFRYLSFQFDLPYGCSCQRSNKLPDEWCDRSADTKKRYLKDTTAVEWIVARNEELIEIDERTPRAYICVRPSMTMTCRRNGALPCIRCCCSPPPSS